jgi:RNA polymerase sigma-70 factor (ECF subfamily)
MDASFHDPEHLLRETSWIRSLAGRLVEDPSLADDLTQETLLRALERPSRLPVAPRAWLAGVLRNVARQGRRSEGRRLEREGRASREEPVPPASAALARLELQRDVVEAVLSLAEPYRSAVVERYFEDRPPREIAAGRNVPVATVKSQIARGIEQLRQRLDRTYGDRRSWGLTLLPLLPIPRLRLGWVSTAARAILMGTLPKVVLGALSAACLALVFHVTRDPAPAARPETPSPDAAHAAETLAPTEIAETATPPSGFERAPVVAASAPSPHTDSQEAAPTMGRLSGTLLDLDGRGLGGTEVVFRPSNGGDPLPFATSNGGGTFAGPLPDGLGTLEVDRTGYATLLAARFDPAHPREELVVVAARSEGYAGRVFDSSGATLAGARLSVVQPQGYRDALEPRLHRTAALARVAESDVEGHFRLDDVPFQEGLGLRAQRAGYEDELVLLPAHSDRGLEVILTPLEADERGWITGVVSTSDGTPVGGAYVSGGGELVRTDTTGRFEFDPDNVAAELRAGAEGFLAATYRPLAGEPWPAFLELTLRDVPLEISGRVLDGQERAIQGHVVWIQNPTVFGESEEGVVVAESIASGGTDYRVRAVTDERGRFTLGGLAARKYRIRAMDPDTALIVDTELVDAGDDDLKVVFLDELYRPTLTGRVLGPNGEPVAGVGVRVETPAMTMPGTEMEMMAIGVSTTTRDDGSFTIARVPHAVDSLYVSSDQVMRTSYDLQRDEERDIVIRVERRVHIHVIAAPDLPHDTTLSILDGEGQALGLTRRIGRAYTQSRAHVLKDGAFDIVSCSATARTLVLTSEGVEFLRRPITPDLEAVTRIEL